MASFCRDQLVAGRFRLLEPLGAGGTAEVWRVLEIEGGREWAAKICTVSKDPACNESLRREYEITRSIDHNSVVGAEQLVESDDTFLLLLPLIEGRELGRGASPSEWLRDLEELSAVLSALHVQSIAHGDLKRANVLVESGRIRLLDFSLATSPLHANDHSAGGGSPYSKSPERWEGAAASPTDDSYAFGSILYELLSGRPPFWPEPTSLRVKSETAATPPVPDGLPADLGTLCMRLLSKVSAKRPTMEQVHEQLKRATRDLPRDDGSSRTPLSLSPPPRVSNVVPTSIQNANDSTPAPRTKRRIPLVVWPVLAIGIAIGFLWLIGFVQPGADSQDSVNPEEPQGAQQLPLKPDSSTVIAPSATKRQAEEALGEVGAMQASLASRKIAAWGGPDWIAAQEAIKRAEENFLQGQWGESVAHYAQAKELLQKEETHAAEVFQRKMSEGATALKEGNAERAKLAFQSAGEINSNSQAAWTGLARAESLDEVTRLLSDGAGQEQEGLLKKAKSTYSKAATLDPHSVKASQSLARVNRQLRALQFNETVTAAIHLIQAGEFQGALKSLEQAEKLKPGDSSVETWRREAQAKLLKAKLVRLQVAGLAAENDEAWKLAETNYKKALDLDPRVTFAIDGTRRVMQRIQLVMNLNFHLDHADRLATKEIRQEAEEILREATAITPRGPQLERLVEDLAQKLVDSVSVVQLVLHSDEQTLVAVYKVGRLGSFQRKTLALKPGRYTIVGTRDGYRDVRLEVRIEANKTPEPVAIRCEERI